MNARKAYEAPEAEVILFELEDVITASGDEAGHSTTGSAVDTRLPRI